MKIRITKPGLMVPVGKVLNVAGGHVPASWAGKWEYVDKPVAEPAPVKAKAKPSDKEAG